MNGRPRHSAVLLVFAVMLASTGRPAIAGAPACDRSVRIDGIIAVIFDHEPLCPDPDANDDQRVTVADIVAVVSGPEAATPTPSPLSSVAPRDTVTPSPRATSTPQTPSPTRTPGGPTDTPSPTASRTRLPTRTPTGTRTRTATRTGSPGPSATATHPPGPSATPTKSITASVTPTRTRTATRTVTFTRTSAATPTPSRTPQAIGPEVTFLGVVGAGDRKPLDPIGYEGPGMQTPIYHWPAPFGFFLVVEFRPGVSRRPVGEEVLRSNPNKPDVLPDFQIKSDKGQGTPTLEVCDAPPSPDVGGVPPITTEGFGGSQYAANAINDFSCRFDVRHSSAEACTNNAQSVPSFVMNKLPVISSIQFCTILGVGSELAFKTGTRTRITVRALDDVRQPGPAKSMIVEIE